MRRPSPFKIDGERIAWCCMRPSDELFGGPRIRSIDFDGWVDSDEVDLFLAWLKKARAWVRETRTR